MKEYRFTVKEPVMMQFNPTYSVTKFEKGHVLTLSEDYFRRLKSGETIKGWSNEGHGVTLGYSYDKSNFENEVERVEVTIETSTVKLGNRKK